MSTTFSATYSVEDNKLRLYASKRLDEDLFKRVKDEGFRWAPKQELFVAPKWTPLREDLCIELAGEISAEESTMVERAQAKADRLDNLAQKRADQSNAFHRAADQLAERFYMGQPILVGHHSEGKARRDQAKMHNAMDKAVKTAEAVQYWQWKAEGVERHANRKANPAVRARRIKTLLAELRDRQRDINHAHICVDLWEKIKAESDQEKFGQLVRYYVDAQLKTGSATPYYRGDSLWSQLNEEKITSSEVVEKCLTFWNGRTNSLYTARWINHILNRLAYERSELGEVNRFEGELTATQIQAFTREHGAHKPKANKQDDLWLLSSSVALPLHIANGKELLLSNSKWCDLMQASGYEVTSAKPRRKSTKKIVPLINPTKEEAERLQALWNTNAQASKGHTTLGGIKPSSIRIMKQAVFSANSKGDYSPFNTIELDSQGNKVWHSYKGASAEAVCRIRTGSGGGSIYSPASIIVLEDKLAKTLPIEWTDTAIPAEELQTEV